MKKISAFVLVALVLSCLMTVYYEQFHSMDQFPLKLTRVGVFFAAHFIVVPALYLISLVWQSRMEIRTVYQPSAMKVLWSLVVFLLTPLTSKLGMFFQVWMLGLMMHSGTLSTSVSYRFVEYLILCIGYVTAYILVCVVRASGMRFFGSIISIGVYFVMVYAIEAFFFGNMLFFRIWYF